MPLYQLTTPRKIIYIQGQKPLRSGCFRLLTVEQAAPFKDHLTLIAESKPEPEAVSTPAPPAPEPVAAEVPPEAVPEESADTEAGFEEEVSEEDLETELTEEESEALANVLANALERAHIEVQEDLATEDEPSVLPEGFAEMYASEAVEWVSTVTDKAVLEEALRVETENRDRVTVTRAIRAALGE